MTIKEDFYEIVNVQGGGFMEEAISDGIKTYLEKLGFNTESISFNINIEMHVDSKRIKEYRQQANEFLTSYCDLLQLETGSSVNDEEMLVDFERELVHLNDFLDEYN